MNKDCFPSSRYYYVRFSRQRLLVKTVAKSQLPQHRSDGELGFGVFPPNRGHASASLILREYVCHSSQPLSYPLKESVNRKQLHL